MNRLKRNVAGQTIRVYAFTLATGAALIDDEANITARITLDGGTPAASNDTNPTQVDATNEKGVYEFALLQGESDAEDYLDFTPQSATAGVGVIVPGGNRFETYPDGMLDVLLDAAAVLSQVAAALATYDGPTDTEMLAAFAALNDISSTEVNIEVDTALADYDGPTHAELTAEINAVQADIAAGVPLEAATQTQIDAILAAVPQLGVFGSVSDATPATTGFDINAALGTTDGERDGQWVMFLTGSANPGIWRTITTHTVTGTPNLAFSSAGQHDAAWPNTPVNGDPFMIAGVGETLV